MKRLPEWVKVTACWLWLIVILGSPVIYTAILNAIGPSTEYHRPEIGSGVMLPDGRIGVFIGDEFFVWITIVRHRVNGNCLFEIERYAEVVDGPRAGRKYLISKTALQFVGANELRRTRWPVPEEKYILGYAVDNDNKPRLDMPLLPDGVEEREFDFYVVGRYFCNALDYLFPRYIQGGLHPNETPRVRAVVKRRPAP